MKNIFLSALFALLMSAHTSAVYSQSSAGRVVEDSIYSNVLNDWRRYSVYLPPAYEPQHRDYPVLYLLHGLSDTHTMWPGRAHLADVMNLLIARGTVCDMVVISPEAGGDVRTVWNGYFDMPGWPYETFFFTEFLPAVEQRYRIAGDKASRAIAGLSMGGGGAVAYAQHHSEMFCAVYAMSALMTIPQRGMIKSENPDDKLSILTRSVIERDCIRYVREADEAALDALRTVSWFVDCGDDDFLLDRNIEFYQAMRDAGVPCQFRVRDGGHVWEYWHSALYICLPYVSRIYMAGVTPGGKSR